MDKCLNGKERIIKRINSFIDNGYEVEVYGFDRGKYSINKETYKCDINIVGEQKDGQNYFAKLIQIFNLHKSLSNKCKSDNSIFYLFGFIEGFFSLFFHYFSNISCFLIVSVFLYIIGPVYFLLFQNAVYASVRFNLFESTSNNWYSISFGQQLFSVFCCSLSIVIPTYISLYFSEETACYYMLISGVLFLLTNTLWIRWMSFRFLKNKYSKLNSFRIN